MTDLNHLAIDGYLLRLFLTVYEEGSVSAAANRLDLAQSAVSHSLQKLRRIVGDPLFVRSGRGIVATAHARRLVPQAQALLENLKVLADPGVFDPSTARLAVVVAANDLQRDLLLPLFFERVSAIAADFRLKVVPSGRPTPEMLRDGHCDLILTPAPPSGTDIIQKRIFDDQNVCFYDARVRAAPATMEDYLAARHITVIHASGEPLAFDEELDRRGVRRHVAIQTPHFSSIPAFMRGNDLLASLPSLLKDAGMREFAMARLPLPPSKDGKYDIARLSMYMVWHLRSHHDSAHVWLRSMIESTVQERLVAARAALAA